MTITGRMATTTDTRGPADMLAAFLAIIGQAPHWPDRACRGHDPSLWDDRLDLTGPSGNTYREADPDRDARHDEARRICHDCPRRAECLATRVADPTIGPGIWGGELFGFERTTGRCGVCNTMFSRPDANTKYCGPGCAQAAHRDHKRVYDATRSQLPGLTHCANCATEIPQERQQHRARSCSERCRKALQRRNARDKKRSARHATTHATPLPCVVCEEPVPHDRRDRGGKTCSPECQAIHRRTTKNALMTAARARKNGVVQIPAATSPEREDTAA